MKIERDERPFDFHEIGLALKRAREANTSIRPKIKGASAESGLTPCSTPWTKKN